MGSATNRFEEQPQCSSNYEMRTRPGNGDERPAGEGWHRAEACVVLRDLDDCKEVYETTAWVQRREKKEVECAQAPVEDEESVDAVSYDDDQPTRFKYSTNMGVVDLADRENAVEYSRVQIKQRPSRQDGVKCNFEGCDKVFPNASRMRRHFTVHEQAKHVCTECRRAFVEKSKLKRHLRVHTDERPYQCPYEECSARFSLDYNLRTHIRTHTGDRPYVCPFEDCGKRFTQSNNLKTHVLTHRS